MKVHHDIQQIPVFKNAVITIGTFDGVHKGHQQIIQLMKTEAAKVNGETVIITFHPHPRQVVSSNSKPVFLINNMAEKLLLLEKYGIEHVVIVPFTNEFASQTAAAYISDFLVNTFRPHTIIIGHDHRFGKGREGDFQLLEDKADEYGYAVKEIPGFVLQDITISSTKIREALLNGDIDTANHFLGYQYFFSGKVIEGNKLGRTIGYPTANLKIENEQKLVPGNGVYAVEVGIVNGEKQLAMGKEQLAMGNEQLAMGKEQLAMGNEQLEMGNKQLEMGNEQSFPSGVRFLKGMMNIGLRPTVDGNNRMIEVNIFDFDKDIYGETIAVTIKKHLRSEQKFGSLDELKNQLTKDKMKALNVES